MQNHRQRTKPHPGKNPKLPVQRLLTPLAPHNAHRPPLHAPLVVKSHPERV